MGIVLVPKTPWRRSEMQGTTSHRGGGNSYSTPTCIGHHPSTSCGVWPQNNRSLREYPIFAHFGSASGLER